LGNFNVGAYGIVLRILNGYIVVTAPEFGITITKRFDDVHKTEDIGALYLDMLKKIGDDVKRRQKHNQSVPSPKVPIDLVPKNDPPTLTIKDAARILCTSEDTVRRLVSDQKIKCIYTRGGHRRFRYSDLEIYLSRTDASTLLPSKASTSTSELSKDEESIPSLGNA
jgi:excisionase family DNA binding protein